jgi:hypothetical protein
MGGGGGGGSINVPSLGQEEKGVLQNVPAVEKSFGNFVQSQPYLQQQQGILKQLGDFGTNIGYQVSPIAGEAAQWGQQAGQQGMDYGSAISNYALPILQNPYDVPSQLLNYATQGARGAAQARGDVGSGEAVAGELMNRENVRQQRLTQAAGMAQQGQALETQGIGDVSAGLAPSQTTEQLLGYPSQQLTAGELGQVGAYGGLVNPLYGLAAAQLGAQTQGQIAGAQADASGKAGTTGLIGAGVGALGSVAIAV